MTYKTSTLPDGEISKIVDLLHEWLRYYSHEEIADKLGYSVAYVKMIDRGHVLPGSPFADKITEHYVPPPEPREYPPTLPVRFESEADKNLVRDRLSNEERAAVLLEKAREG